MFSLSVESDLGRGGKQLEKLLDKSIEKAQKEALKIVTRDARNKHRYTRRTGTLERAVGSEIVRDVARAYVSDSLAPYGVYVHQGTKHWAEDPFLTNALERNRKKITDLLDDAVEDAIKKSGFKR